MAPLIALSVVLLAAWALYALVLRPLVPATSSRIEFLASLGSRTLFWGGPCLVYLVRVHARGWAKPLGLGFPFGGRQVLRAFIVSAVVSSLLLWATAQQLGVTSSVLVATLLEQAQPRLTAPLFEELVFRGVIVSEALRQARERSQTAGGWRLRFWGAQLAAAALFTLVHWPYWLAQHGLAATLSASLPLFTTGLVLGVVFAQTRSLWPCVFLHWLNNELSTLDWTGF